MLWSCRQVGNQIFFCWLSNQINFSIVLSGAMTFNPLEILPTCHFVKLLFQQPVISSSCNFSHWPFCQLVFPSNAILSIWYFNNLVFRKLAVLPIGQSVSLPFSQLAFHLHTIFFYDLHFQQLAILPLSHFSICHYINKPFHQCVISSVYLLSTFHFLNLSFCDVLDLS